MVVVGVVVSRVGGVVVVELLGAVLVLLGAGIIIVMLIGGAVGMTLIGGTSLHGGSGAGVSVAVDTTVQQGS